MRQLVKHIIPCIFVLLAPIQAAGGQEVYEAEKLPISSGLYDEFAPTPWNEGLIFMSNRRTDFFYTFNNEKNKAPWNLFWSKPNSRGEWREPRIWDTEFKTNANDGPVAFDPGGTKIYITRNYDAPRGLGNVRDRTPAGIFTATTEDGRRWTDPLPFEHNDERRSSMHPCVSPNGKLLFFSSNRSDGQGGYDLYVCRLNTSDSTWSEPENLGPLVNTRGHEVMPFYQSTGRLFFSSNRHPGLGRYDIFYTEQLNGVWETPINMGAPINSRRDDISFIADNRLTEGYFASDRDRRSASLYSFSLNVPEFEECPEQQPPDYCFTFYEEGSMDIDTTSLMYEWRVEGRRIRGKECPHCFSGPGLYEIQLNVIDMLTDSVMYNEASYEFLLEDEEQVFITSPDTVYVGDIIHFDNHRSVVRAFEVERFYWDMGDDIHRSDTALDHRYFKPGIYTVKCGAVNDADTPEELMKTCNSKKVYVLPRDDFFGRKD